MNPKVLILLALVVIAAADTKKKRIVKVGVGQPCTLGAAPVGPGGSWQLVEKGVKKVCVKGSSCRDGACNCDNLADGTVTGQEPNPDGTRSCKHLAGQKCSRDAECFEDVKCTKGKCTCDETKKADDSLYCQAEKNDITILD